MLKPALKHSKLHKLRLALDIGTNSIGWAMYGIDQNKKPCRIIGAGVRVFSSGREDKNYTTLNAGRRQARLQRRQRDRYLQRKHNLLHLLKNNGLLPKDTLLAKKLESLNPYELRAKGLDKKLDIHHFGRVLFHLNQRRGFKSNRKSANDEESGVIARSINISQKEMQKLKIRTYGEFLWKKFQKMEKSRKTSNSQENNWILARRPVGHTTKDNYVVYAQRKMMEDEFNKLWEHQAKHHKLLNKSLKEKIHKAIFDQRPLKKPIVGICELTDEKRIPKALPSFQQFRILKELNNLSYITNSGDVIPINSIKQGIDFRNKIIKDLFSKKSKINFSALEKEFLKFFPNITDFNSFNLDTDNRDFLEGNKTSIILRKVIPNWDTWKLAIQDRFIELLEGENKEGLFMKEDEEVLEDLQKFNKDKNLKLSNNQLNKCLKLLVKLPKDHGQYSKKAISKILPLLDKGQLEYQAIAKIYGHHSDRRYKGELKNKLPAYQEVLKSHCVEMRPTPPNSQTNKPKNKKEKYKTFRIPNPTVHIAFNQLRLVVNDIITHYRKPSEIVIETARDLPIGPKTKQENNKNQKQNKEKNEEAQKMILEFKQKNTRDNRIRCQLWKEQKEYCIYSGKKIPKSKLFTSEIEVDHILPWSRTLDDAFSNKILVYKITNQHKGSQTPYEYFASNKSRWQSILQRVKELPKNKSWRFNKTAMDKFKEVGGFLARQLNDTRYISRHAKEYLERICQNVWTVRGQTTAILRHLLQHKNKSRDDHRNHAEDALVIGLIDRGFVKKVSAIAKNIEGKNKQRLENIGKAIKSDITPWSNFKDDAKQIINKVIVSHRRRTKKEGQLHNETAYGFVPETTNFSKAINVFHYIDIGNLVTANKTKLEKIISPKIKNIFLKEFEQNNKLSKEFLINYHKKTGIRRVKITEKQTVIPIKNKQGQIYKSFKTGGNYAVKLFVKSNNKWDAEIITTFTANQKGFKDIPKNQKLMKGDMLFFEHKFWRLVKFDQNKVLIFIEHYVQGNPNIVRKNPETKEQVSQKTCNSLQESNPKRVNISPCGMVKLTSFNLKTK